MGVSTNGQISYGIPFEEGFEFPWSANPWDGDQEQWWRDVNNYVNPLFNPFTEDGNYAAGVGKEDPRIGEYFAHQQAWEKANPVPVELVNYCSGDYPMWMLVAPELGLTNNRGYPKVFVPADLVATEEHRKTLLDFCNRWGIETSEEPKWYLSSYWG